MGLIPRLLHVEFSRSSHVFETLHFPVGTIKYDDTMQCDVIRCSFFENKAQFGNSQNNRLIKKERKEEKKKEIKRFQAKPSLLAFSAHHPGVLSFLPYSPPNWAADPPKLG